MKKYIKLIIILIFIIPLNVKAANINLICPEKTSSGKTIKCEITLTSDIPTNAVSLKYKLPQEISYNKLETKEQWQETYNQKYGLVVTKSNNSQTSNKIADLYLTISNEVKLNNEYTITLTDIDISDINYQSETIKDVSTTIKIISDDNTLSKLTITNGKLSPTFNKNKTEYTATVNKDNTTIIATPSDKNAQLTGDLGNQKLNYGANYFQIIVTSQLGNNKIYKLTITRPAPQTKPNDTNNHDNDATLKELIIKNHEINFKKEKYNYNLTISNEITNLEIIATPTNEKSTVKIENNENLKVGENVITITVTSPNGTVCKYILNVEKLDYKLSSDNTIKKITIENYELDFSKNKQDYNLTINNEQKLNIKVELNDEKAKYKITGNKNLKNDSIITITVTAEDKSVRKYKIKITKKNYKNTKIISNKTIIIIIITTIIISITGILTTKVIKKNNKKTPSNEEN